MVWFILIVIVGIVVGCYANYKIGYLITKNILDTQNTLNAMKRNNDNDT